MEAERDYLRQALVVTALPIEMLAVRAHLTDLGTVVGRDKTLYECGRFSANGSDWLVVVAQTGPGNHTAQSVVTYAHIDFGAFENLIFVGVGGSRKEDVPIGSVIASSRVYMPYGGKYAPDGYSGRPRQVEVQHGLVQLAAKVCRDRLWQRRIVPPLSGTLPSQNAYPRPYPPAACVAPIVSVESVSADPNSQLERHIAQHYGDAHAVEMEGYGTVFAANREGTPCIIIRGVSDMASHKTPTDDAITQPVAAVHAAAFGFELLDLWGQINRPVQRPPVAALRDTSSQGSTRTNASSLPPNRLVLIFDGDAETFSPDKVDAIVKLIRDFTGDHSIKAAGHESGSFRLLIEAPVELHEKLAAPDLKELLASKHNVKLVGVMSEADYRTAQQTQRALTSASHNLASWARHLPDGTWLDRPELERLLETIEQEEHSTTVLLGAPGSGKSALLAAVVVRMAERRWPVLGIKADLLDPDVRDEQDLARVLGLPELPSILLERISAVSPVVLAIDQLDALAGYVDLKTGRLNAILNLVRRLGGRPNVHVVMSARTFEYEHDVRLRSISAASLRLELPPWHVILPILESKGVQAAGWPIDAQEVLRSPQALSIFLRLNAQSTSEPSRTYQAMLDRVWSERIVQARDGPRLVSLTSEIATTMADEESLSLASARFDDRAADLQALESLGILARFGAGGSVGFTHQTLFEHALARGFARGKGRLSKYILGREASLFIRPKLWSALTYLRDVEPSTYEAELQAIWAAPMLRPHLRLLLIEFMGQQAKPSELEILLMTPVLSEGGEYAVAFRAIAGSSGWFERVGNSLIANAMTRDQTSAAAAVGVLAAAWSVGSERVIALLSDRWRMNSAFDSQSWAVLEACPAWTPEVADLAVGIIRRSEVAPSRVDTLASIVGVEHPKLALRLVFAKLDRALEVAKMEANRLRHANPRPESANAQELVAWRMTHAPERPIVDLLENYRDWDHLPTLAASAPEDFLATLWPWFQAAFAALRQLESSNSERASAFFCIPIGIDFRFEEEDMLGLPAPSLMDSLRVAVERLAGDDPFKFLTWVEANEGEDAAPIQRLIAHAFATHPEPYAQRALNFLLSDQRRLRLGSIHDLSGTTKRLVRTTAPFWPQEDFARFERAVRDYAPAPPSRLKGIERRHFLNALRWIRLGIFRVLPDNRISDAVRRLIAEDTRVFPIETEPTAISGGFIGPPMETESMRRASDDNIVNAFCALPDATGWRHPRSWDVGGNIELSRAFSDFAKIEPNRAARILARFQPGIGERAAGYALEAMAEAVDGQLIIDLFIDLSQRGFASEEFRCSAARAIERLVNRDMPIADVVLRVLESWLEIPCAPVSNEGRDTSDDDDTGEESGTTLSKTQERTHDDIRSLLWDPSGFTVLPHGNFPILEALMRILLARRDSDRMINILERHLARPEDPSVWRALLRYFIYLRPTRNEARTSILKTLFDKLPHLLRTREAVHLLSHAHWWAPDLVREAIESWLPTDDRWLKQAYGELSALIAIVRSDLPWAVENLRRIVADLDLEEERVGAAFAATNLWKESGFRATSSELLMALIPGANAHVWTAVYDLFRLVDELHPEPHTIRLLQTISDHIGSAGRLDAAFLVERLQTLLPHEAPLVGRIARGLVSNWHQDLGDFRTGTVLTAPDLVDLAITLHRLGPSTREVGTSLFEDLLVVDAYSARQTLNEIDNRFVSHMPLTRRRLSRRPVRRPRLLH